MRNEVLSVHIQIVLFEGFDLLDAIAPYEVFSAAAMYSNEQITVELVTVDGEEMVTSGVNDLKLPVNGKLDLSCEGIILIPGASGSVEGNGPDSVPMILKKASETELSGLLEKAMKKPEILLSTVCGGSLILAMAGLLEGRHAVTHHMGMGLLDVTDAIPVNARIVDDGNLVTGGGVTSGLDVALYLVERELGPRIALAVEELFEYERRGTVWRESGDIPKKMKQDNFTKTTSEHSFIQAEQGNGYQGEWDIAILTPIGKLSVLLDITSIDGQMEGTAIQDEETVTLENLTRTGDKLTWSMKVTKPMKLTLKFNVFVEGNNMYGEARAGVLPPSKLTGHRLI